MHKSNTGYIEIKKLNVLYGGSHALKDITISIDQASVTAFIGRSGCGKSTLLRCINRMNDFIDNCTVTGSVMINDQDINNPSIDIVKLRRRISMVFQQPNPFYKSIFDNVAYGARIHGLTKNRLELNGIVEDSLRKAHLWDEVNHKLHTSALDLSGGQQQRLCIARTLAVKPDVILMDEPCASLDPLATIKIEELIEEISKTITIIIVTHSMQQAARISDKVAFFDSGKLVEHSSADQFFTAPADPRSLAYITGRTLEQVQNKW